LKEYRLTLIAIQKDLKSLVEIQKETARFKRMQKLKKIVSMMIGSFKDMLQHKQKCLLAEF
jgi:hypothetical protein